MHVVARKHLHGDGDSANGWDTSYSWCYFFP